MSNEKEITEGIQHPEEHDLTKVRELCSLAKVRLFEIMGQLDNILDVVRAIQVPTLSTYKKIEVETAGTAAPIQGTLEVKQVETVVTSVFKPAKPKDLQSIGLALAKNLEMQLKEKKEGK